MSYDLYFIAPKGNAIDSNSLAAYFKRRRHYTVNGNQAVYGNSDTGVYFTFDLALSPGDFDGKEYAASFNLNYYRPHPFALEAEREVSLFVRQFSFDIDDPQLSGMGSGPYSKEGFLSGWNTGNAFAHKAMKSQGGTPELTMPRSALHSVWQWNFYRDDMLDSLQADVFIPLIMFLKHEGRVGTTVVWGDAIPIALPKVDFVLLMRRELASKPFWKSKAEDEYSVVSYGQLLPAIKDFSEETLEQSFRLGKYSKPSDDLVKFFKSQPTVDRKKLSIIPFEQVLDSELAQQ